MVAALVLAAIGWPGVIVIVAATLPTVGPRWLFFLFLTTAVTGTALPFVWLLHRRFVRAPAPAPVLLRQGLWVGLYTGLCVWLQINRSLNLSLALLIAGGLAAFEWLVRVRERSAWRPGR
jgi:Flp pilus assembly protein protease CpaA